MTDPRTRDIYIRRRRVPATRQNGRGDISLKWVTVPRSTQCCRRAQISFYLTRKHEIFKWSPLCNKRILTVTCVFETSNENINKIYLGLPLVPQSSWLRSEKQDAAASDPRLPTKIMLFNSLIPFEEQSQRVVRIISESVVVWIRHDCLFKFASQHLLYHTGN